MCINNKYSVIVGEYAKKHFIKSFSKKYKSAWEKTFTTIENVLSRIVAFSRTSKVNQICVCEHQYIAKCEFNIEWQKTSTKTSWNRIIVYVDEELFETKILLLYAKTDIKWEHETAWWKSEVKNNYSDIAEIFPNL